VARRVETQRPHRPLVGLLLQQRRVHLDGELAEGRAPDGVDERGVNDVLAAEHLPHEHGRDVQADAAELQLEPRLAHLPPGVAHDRRQLELRLVLLRLADCFHDP
jgi:hypothetical protein